MNQEAQNYIKITLPHEYPWVLFTAAMICLQCWFLGYAKTMSVRRKIFSKQYMEENFGRQHMQDEAMQAQGASLADLANGYPDTGNGRYAEKLEYKDWYTLNRVQSSHRSFLESLTIIVVLLLVNGIANPYTSIAAGVAFFIHRIIYFEEMHRFWGAIPVYGIITVLSLGSILSILQL